MSDSVWRLFPYPTLADGKLSAGALLDVHPECARCPTRACAEDTSLPLSQSGQCRFGISYARIDSHRIVIGVLDSDLPNPTKRSKRRRSREPERRVRSSQLRAAVDRAIELGPGVVDDHDRNRAEMMKSLESNPELHKSIADNLRKDFALNLSQSHDFLQLVSLVRGHAEALLHERFPELPSLDAAEKLPTEGAIFFLTELMLNKMDSLVFLNEVNLAIGEEKSFQLHPFVLKYVRVYNSQAKQKDLSIHLSGDCFASCRYNNQAIGAVIQGLLDNMVKYAPAGSKSAVLFDEGSREVVLTFTSLGPRIDPDERAQIFLPNFRARAARKVGGGGMGIGLAISKQVSDALDLRLRVTQEPNPDATFIDRFETSFQITLRKST